MSHKKDARLIWVKPSRSRKNKAYTLNLLGVRVVRSLLQLSERWPCHIMFVACRRMKFATLEVNLSGVEAC